MSTLISHLRTACSSAARIKKYCAQADMPFVKYSSTLSEEFIHCSAFHNAREVAFFVKPGALLEKYGLKDARFAASLTGDKFLTALYAELIASRTPGREWFADALTTITIKDLHYQPLQHALYSAGDDINFIWFSEESLSSLAITDKENGIDWSGLSCPVSLVLETMPLPAHELHRLAMGDVITLRSHSAILLAANRPLYTVSIDEHSFTVSDKIMTENKDPNASLPLWAGDALTLNVEFVLAQTAMTLDQISHLQPGDVLGTEMGINENKVSVQLRVQGKTIASGELILLDDRLAVEIEHVCSIS